MSSESEVDNTEAPGDEQRLLQLEKGRKLDRILFFTLTAVLTMILASWLTASVFNLLHEKESNDDADSLVALQDQLSLLEKKLATLQQQVDTQSTRLSALPASTPGATMPTVERYDDRELRRQLAKTLIGQEQGFQQSLVALKTGMRDLAGMIAGSRSWLSFYQEALDKPLAGSNARVKELQQWSAPAVPAAKKP
ncbi:hypothetical protein FBY03_11159 [Pseudomonas sp. SJZ079]|uniref:hypothetical protein n=1 Tax=Pseudomonas sp. SJZ079 TaxID=2572887 RepID=UPI0011991904|nr:hypothetical protein [Pseudomonas sp. SJZ079]TWC35014.1 hypothetical protein FBY03_11159 [Pseudomonas sp. SJZ079]